MTDLTQQALKLLAASHDEWGMPGMAASIRNNAITDTYTAAALNAVKKALRTSTPDAGGRDAERWRFCVENNVMPVIANDGKTWCMFVAVTSGRRSLFTGGTPDEAVDAAIAQREGS